MGGGAKVSANICKCCGGNGWEGSDCQSIRSENARLWREYEFGLGVIEKLRLKVASQAKELQSLQRMKNALLKISKIDWPVTRDFYWTIAKDALLQEEEAQP
jgi:hypothetical protein